MFKCLFTHILLAFFSSCIALKFENLSELWLSTFSVVSLNQGYNSKDQKGNLFDDWDLSEPRGELSEVFSLSIFSLLRLFVSPQ